MLKEGVYLKTIFDIFKYQIPVELHEDALYAIVNLLQDCPKQLKLQIYELGVANPLLKFVHDLHDIETEILRENGQ